MMTNDDEIRLALRWSVTDVTKDQLVTSAINWNDEKKV